MTLERFRHGDRNNVIDIKPYLLQPQTTPDEFITRLGESVTTTLENDIKALTKLQESEFIIQPQIKTQPKDNEDRVGRLYKLTTFARDHVYPKTAEFTRGAARYSAKGIEKAKPYVAAGLLATVKIGGWIFEKSSDLTASAINYLGTEAAEFASIAGFGTSGALIFRTFNSINHEPITNTVLVCACALWTARTAIKTHIASSAAKANMTKGSETSPVAITTKSENTTGANEPPENNQIGRRQATTLIALGTAVLGTGSFFLFNGGWGDPRKQGELNFLAYGQLPDSLDSAFPFPEVKYRGTIYGISLEPFTKDDWDRVKKYHNVISETAKNTYSGCDNPAFRANESVFDTVTRWGFDPGLLFLSIMMFESRGQNTISKDGVSYGLMQVTADASTPSGTELLKPETNIKWALMRFLDKIRRHPFDAKSAIQAYNSDNMPDDYARGVISFYKLLVGQNDGMFAVS